MSNLPVPQFDETGWRTRTLVIGAVGGLLVGLAASFLYLRGSEEYVRKNGQPPKAGNGELLGLLVAAIAVVRQISELGRPDAKRR